MFGFFLISPSSLIKDKGSKIKKMKFILGQKIGMSQVFTDKGKVVPVTLVEAGPCVVTQIKTREKDGYQAVQIGFGEVRKLTKPLAGHLKDLGKPRYLREFEDEIKNFKVGQKIDVSVFKEGDKVKVSGISKAKGFTGVVKRHGFKGSPATHGTKHTLRAPGSIGSAFPEKVFKGMKMAGRMGGGRITVTGLKIAKIDKENNLLAIGGAVPGKKGTLLEIVANS